jgi:hypothetical protein
MKKSGVFRYIRIVSFRTVSCWHILHALARKCKDDSRIIHITLADFFIDKLARVCAIVILRVLFENVR